MSSAAPRRSSSDDVVVATRSARILLINARLGTMLFSVAAIVPAADVIGVFETSQASASRWQAAVALLICSGLAYWTGAGVVLHLALTEDGRIRWQRAFASGEIHPEDLDRIDANAAPLLYVVHHAHGRLRVFLLPGMSAFVSAMGRPSS